MQSKFFGKLSSILKAAALGDGKPESNPMRVNDRKSILLDKEVKAFMPMAKGGAVPAHVKEAYEEHWGKRITGIQAKLDRGESLAHILSSIRKPPHLLNSYNRVADRIAQEYLPDDTPVTEEGIRLSRLGVAGARYSAVSNFDPIYEIFRLASRSQIIVELGSGPGWNLFDMCIHLGIKVKDKRIFALEYTDAGLEITRRLANHENLPIKEHFFDYTNPDLSMLPDDGDTLIFSHHSIEQVETISPKLYEQILERKSDASLVHCEPIGWQRFPELTEARMRQDDEFFAQLVRKRTDDLHSNSSPAINAAINSWRTRYNRNAMALLRDFEMDIRVQKVCEYFDFTQRNNSNPVNPSTYLQFRIKKI